MTASNPVQRNQPNSQEVLAGAARFLRMIRKHWPLVVASLLLGCGLSLVYSKSMARIYQSSSMVELNPNPVRPLAEKDTLLALGGDFDNHEYYETQLKIVTSSRIMLAAARSVALANDWSFFGALSAPEKPFTDEQAAYALRSRVSVEPVRNSRLITIRVTDTVPERARRLCDAVTNAYIDQNLEKAISASSDSVVWLAGQVDTVKKELDQDENALHEFKQTNDLPSTSINESSNMVRQELQDLTSALTRVRTRRQEVVARRNELSKVSKVSPDQLAATEFQANGFLQTLRHEYQKDVANLTTLVEEGKGENHPSVKAARASLEAARSALLQEVANVKGAVERDLSAIIAEEAGKQRLYDDAHKRAVDLTMKEIQYHRLDRSRNQNEKLYGMLIDHMKEADLARMMRVNNLHVVEPADMPRQPISPRTRLNVTAGAVVGLLIGLGLIWTREALDTSIKTPDDVEHKLGMPFLGLFPINAESVDLPRRKLGKARAIEGPPELIVHLRPLSGLAEAARSVRTNLMFTSPDHPLRKLLVTSAAPAEGKTTVACSLAIAFAQSGQRVCIVDCDLRRPRLHRIFDRAGDFGVTNVIVGDAKIVDVAKPTIIDNLWCIPSGPIPPNPADLLHSERFRNFVRELGEQFDRVILDSPPIVAVTDAAIVSTAVDGTVFVIRAFATTTSLAKQGLRALSDVDAPLAGAVLNAVDLAKHEYGYGYYYYKRDGYGPIEPTTNPSETERTEPPQDRPAAN